MHKSAFITFEGGEGSGKTSVLKKIESYLQALGYKTLATRAPGGTSLGAQIRELLLHKEKIQLCKKAELFLFLSDRAQHVQELVLPALKENKVVLCDRFNDSTIAYQGAARNEQLSFIENLCEYAVDELKPDLTFYLDIDPSVGLIRAKKAIKEQGKATYDRMENEALAFHQRVRECYLKLVQKEPHRFIVLDASMPLEQVVSLAIQKLSIWMEKL